MRVEFRALNGKQIDVLAKLAGLDARSVEKSWPMSKFDVELGRRHTHGIGAIDPMGNLLSYLIYDVTKDEKTKDGILTIVRLVVSPNHRRMGLATRMMDQLKSLSKMIRMGDLRITVEVSESNIEAWKFFREYGKRSRLGVKTYLVKNDPDDYFGFTFSHKEQMACAS